MEMLFGLICGICVGVTGLSIWFILSPRSALPIMRCRERIFYGGIITSAVIDNASLALRSSHDLDMVLDFLIADLCDQANVEIVELSGTVESYGPQLAQAGGRIFAANALATSIEKLKKGELAKEMADAEQRLYRKNKN